MKPDSDVVAGANETLDSVVSSLVGGLTSAARRRPELGGHPFWVTRGEGAYLWDIEGKKYIDINAGHGGAQVGHSHPAIKEALRQGIELGHLCGQETLLAGRVASRITKMVPCAELVRFVFTGTKATELAIRVARGYTGRLKVIKFEGHYHGFNESLQFNMMFHSQDQPGPRECPTVRCESTGGIPEAANHIIIVPWNDLEILEKRLEQHGSETAAIIMEPINYNAGVLMPRPGYLEAVRDMATHYGVVLIFDEVLSGFRTGPDLAQGYYGVTPDLCTMGKALGAGMPIGALAGRKKFMEAITPIGDVVDSGTYYGQVLVMKAAKAFLDVAADPAVWEEQKKICGRFHDGLSDIFSRHGAGHIQALGNRFGMHFGLQDESWEYRDWAKRDGDLEREFFAATFKHGVYFMKSPHHGISWAHTEKDVDDALEGIEASLCEAMNAVKT